MPKPRRRRAGSLRGWWRALPFIAMGGGLLFCFTWLETERLHNEYRAIDLTREIRHVKDRINDLRGRQHRLSRLERMQEAAPELELVEPKPGQIQIVSIDRDGLYDLLSAAPVVEPTLRPTRSALLTLEGAPATNAPEPYKAMAQSEIRGAATVDTQF